MKVILKESDESLALRPFTALRSAADIRLGYFTIKEKWALMTGQLPSMGSRRGGEEHEFWAGSFPSEKTVRAWRETRLIEGSALCRIEKLTDLFGKLDQGIATDVALLSAGSAFSEELPGAVVLGRGRHPLIVFEGARAEGAIINLNHGPVVLGPESEVMEGAMIRGPFVLGERSVVKMGAKIYGPTAIGPHCKVGGELSNVLFQGFANKAHDGFLGNSAIGEWCNLGADTNCSNLKNNYSDVRQWNYRTGGYEATGLQFCGLVMGDHAKCGINTMFNTGTVVGVGANVFGGGFPPKFVPDFGWGGAEGLTEFHFDRFLETARAVMNRRGQNPDSEYIRRLEGLFEETRPLRHTTK
jgi:UDP-N-acetylglucosamine diphosphorylase/glucosamine-1-phosphate N-acetyltransferase